jgi:chitodextrinase
VRNSSRRSRLSITAAFVLCASPGAFALPPPDELPPTTPGGFRVTANSTGNSLSFAWNASTDNRGVTQYWFYRCQSSCTFLGANTNTQLTFTASGLTSGTNYLFQVIALDAAGNQSDPAELQAAPIDVVAPSQTGTLSAGASGTQVTLSWGPSTDNVAVGGYSIEQCTGAGCAGFSPVATTIGTSYTTPSLAAATTYQFRVRAYDTATPNANFGVYSNIASALTADTTPPNPPTTLNANVPTGSGTQVDLSWSGASDNVAIWYYEVEYCAGSGCNNFVGLASPSGTTYSATGLTPATRYNFRVRARDTSSLTSIYSPTATALTNDTLPPSTPGNFSATAATSVARVDLGWSASTDNVAVNLYAVERCVGAGCASFTQIGTTTSTNYSDSTVTAATPYKYRVRAYDAANNYSASTSEIPVTTADTVPPGAPGTLTANPVSASRIDLSWGAASDNVAVSLYSIERCQGAGCSNFAEIATTTGTAYSNTGLPEITTFNYRVRARDAALNYGPPTTAVPATTRDGTAPQVPTGLTATAVSGTQINLTWTAPTDNVAVTGYSVERCAGSGCSGFLEIATPANAGYNDMGLSNGTLYRYRVRARDAVPNWSPYAGPVDRQTNDTQPPSAPTGLGLTVISPTQINVSWTASTDNVGVALYSIERCAGAACTSFAEIDTSASSPFNNTGLTPGTTYRYQVRARDAAMLWSGYAGPLNATTSTDTQAPSVPTGVVANVQSATQINLTWNASTDNIAVAGYIVERCVGSGCTSFTQLATSSTTTYNNSGLTPNTTYRYQVRAVDAAPNTSGPSTPPATATTQADTSAPSAPASLQAASPTATQVNLSWGASTDNVAVTGYIVERCQGSGCTSFAQIGMPAASPFSDTGRSPSTLYRYQVRARDAAGNQSANAGPISWTTPADTAAPSVPSNLRSTEATTTTISLAWDPSTDDVGVADYRVERCQGSGCTNFAEVGSSATTAFTSSGLTHTTTYRFRVRARDGGNNDSAPSSPITVSTNDGQAPSTPAGLTLVVSPGQIRLSWNASTDNVGVTVYLIARCNVASCTYVNIGSSPTTSFIDASVLPGTNYSYQVAARDAQGNVSGYSTAGAALAADCD